MKNGFVVVTYQEAQITGREVPTCISRKYFTREKALKAEMLSAEQAEQMGVTRLKVFDLGTSTLPILENPFAFDAGWQTPPY